MELGANELRDLHISTSDEEDTEPVAAVERDYMDSSRGSRRNHGTGIIFSPNTSPTKLAVPRFVS